MMSVLVDRDWSYPACHDQEEKVSIANNRFHCELCNEEPHKTWPRYRIEIELEDSTTVSSFTLFDSYATKLLNNSAEDLSFPYLQSSLPSTYCHSSTTAHQGPHCCHPSTPAHRATVSQKSGTCLRSQTPLQPEPQTPTEQPIDTHPHHKSENKRHLQPGPSNLSPTLRKDNSPPDLKRSKFLAPTTLPDQPFNWLPLSFPPYYKGDKLG